MTDNKLQKTIKLNDENILRLKIVDKDGNETGESLDFQFDDIELPLKYQEMIEKDKKNKELLRNKILVIEKQQDHKGKKLLSSNEEASIKALNEFFQKEKEIYNMFLGENGVEKLLNGRKLGWTTLQEIDEIIEKQISPYVNLSLNNITDMIKAKYKETLDKEVLK